MAKHSEFINGVCQQLLFSPRGGIEGALLKVKGALLQISVPPETGAVLARTTGPAKRLRVLALADHSPRTADGAHPVYRFESFADAAGQPIEPADADADNITLKGVVAALHFARHGQPNGVILESGEFIHLRPHGMALAGLGIGSRVNALGSVRNTLLGTRMLEARQVNRIQID